jgi:hypothetical protein
MLMCPQIRSPMGFKWTASLLHRDVKALKSKYTTKITSALSRKHAKASRSPHQHTAERSTIDSAVVSVQVDEVPNQQLGDTPDTAASSTTTSVCDTEEVPSTRYEVLDTKLKALYASRDRDVSHAERWRFRGSWLVLYMAIQACPSNDCYKVFRGEESSSSSQPISPMPAAIYSQPSQDGVRYDSAFSTVLAPKSTEQLWLAVIEGAGDPANLMAAVEELMQSVWPEGNAKVILERVGDPAKTFERDAELMARLRELLFPGYEALSRT